MQKMKIVVLDGNAVNPGDLSWGELEKLGEVTVYPRSSRSEALERAKDADIILNNKVRLDRSLLEKFDNLKYIGLLSTGYDVVDVSYAESRKIPVCNVPAYSSASVAQLTIALLLEACMGVGKHDRSVKDGDWAACPDFCYTVQSIEELDGKSIGLVGYGSIAAYVAKIARALGMKVYGYNRKGKVEGNAEYRDLDWIIANCDVISLHCPLNADSAKMINKHTLDKVKTGAIVINTARGGLVDEDAVADALDSGKLAGYCADVSASEPPSRDNRLLSHPKAIITPHVAWASVSARRRCLKIACDNIREFLEGKVVNCVY
ncbi:MAG: D-2-hydroxyacid dehydrogenase [Christensenellales bacterium]